MSQSLIRNTNSGREEECFVSFTINLKTLNFWLNPFDRLDRKEDNASHVRYRTVPELDVWDRRDGIRFPSCRKPIITTHNTTTWHVAMFSNTADWDDV